ncbi:hypothetical protein [Streptomyces diastatochromogenes]|uniref:Uncharacterized protein n=1 Tax=Streptomyces diastatochromogenes TaxID=42236 RepID=A0A233SXZ2_STRDA|nr:hypothetical protein [Streptomyces diastatochromogenes]MCZ0991780.1 hypothetical protein [Streptomyces diastatochromogenes]OXZ00511.1 hypothetical protein BEK98_00095 [Streptomyces diastatochromogenes]
MPHHALEITLTRALNQAELDAVCRRMPLAANHGTTRLMALVDAKTPHRAARRLRHQLGGLLPIDVITTHYPDAEHKVLLNVAFPFDAHAAVKAEARRAGLTSECFMELAVHRALAHHAEREIDRLHQEVRQLLAHTSPAHLLSAVGHALARLPKDPTS